VELREIGFGAELARLAFLQCLAVEHDKMTCVISNSLRKYFSAMGRKSVKARMKKLSAEERRKIARNAAKARWAKPRSRKKGKRRTGRKR